MGGCCSKRDAATQAAKQPLKCNRLSITNIDGTLLEDGLGAGAKVEFVHEDRLLISSLSEQNIIEVIEAAGQLFGHKMSISCRTEQDKTSFREKDSQTLGDELDLAAFGMGYTCRKGLKPESPNQDSWFVLKTEACSIYAVFDGHGQHGHDISQFVKENLPKLILKDPCFKSGDKETMLKDVFKTTQSLVRAAHGMKLFDADLAGTTATVCLHEHVNNRITMAHVSDSTAALGTQKGPDAKDFEGIALTRDHKPDLKDERERIEKAGGRVDFDGINHRIFAKDMQCPGLAMSRCLGDLMAHTLGAICEPEVSTRDLKPDDSLLLLCSDGVWEFISPTEAFQIVGVVESGKTMQAAERLAKEAWDRWIREENGEVVDDITVILVNLKHAVAV